MSETVFILGAGASKAAGAPLMRDFLDVADRLRKTHQTGNRQEDFELVFKGIGALERAHSKAAVDIDNVESVFAAFEMAKLIGRLGELPDDDVERLPGAMRRVIEVTIEETVEFPISQGRIVAPVGYAKLAKLILEVCSSPVHDQGPRFPGSLSQFSVITFNYDLCLDFAFHSASVPVGYGLGPFKDGPSVHVLKLHGSLNWGACKAHGVVAWPLADYFAKKHFLLEDMQSFRLQIGSRLTEFQHCSGASVDGPLVVPPTWNKGQYQESLVPVWRTAAWELSQAENIFVCGYSLPETDQFFRYLYALGTIGPVRLKKFWVFNPDQNAEDHFRRLLGQAVLPRFQFHRLPFDQMFSVIYPVFALPTNFQ